MTNNSKFSQYPETPWRRKLYAIIFESDTPAGKTFDILLLVAIVLSILVVSLESVTSIRLRYGWLLVALEWVFTILFTVEYILRLLCTRYPLAYARSFFGVVDLLSVLPTYIGLFITGTHYLLVVRILRLLRVFRVLKLGQYMSEAAILRQAISASQKKISVFLLAVVTIVVIVGALMYLVEGPAGGFDDIPTSMYWAIVTLTTVGYGDISPVTPMGKFLASVLMLVGYGIIAVPTGIVTSELSRAAQPSSVVCPVCERTGHASDARYCKYCGAEL